MSGLVPARAAGRPLQIWPLGDSITVGSSAQPSPGGYRTSLDQLLTREGVGHHFIGSWTANSSATLDLDDESGVAQPHAVALPGPVGGNVVARCEAHVVSSCS